MKDTFPDSGLFERERAALRAARASAAAELPADEGGRAACAVEAKAALASFAEEYGRLLAMTERAFRISDVQGRALKAQDEEMRSILDNSKQGFLTFAADLSVRKSYSRECERLFGRPAAGQSISELLSEGDAGRGSFFAEVFGRAFQAESLDAACAALAAVPGVVRLGGRDVALGCKALSADPATGRPGFVMVVLTELDGGDGPSQGATYYGFHDKLTSLYNRAYIESVLPQILSRSGGMLSLIMADLNGLKLTNDAFGHESGDRLIESAARVFLACCRKDDIVARWGGDEFLILLPSISEDACQFVVRRIKSACAHTAADPVKLSFALGSASAEGSEIDVRALMEKAEGEMYRNKLAESRRTRRRIIESLGDNLCPRCFVSAGHGERVRDLAAAMASRGGWRMSSGDRTALGLLARLHDIGKVAIPASLLGKNGALDPEELEVVHGYVEAGYRMARAVEEPALADGILALREKWDGSGYPGGLSGEAIPLISRIVAVAESYDVMTHERPYRAPVAHDLAVQEIEGCSGSAFDPEACRLFLEAVDSRTDPSWT